MDRHSFHSKFVVPIAALLVMSAACVSAGRQAAWTREPTQTTGSALDAAASSASGDALWAQRGERVRLEAAIAAWEAALEGAPNDAELLLKIGRGYYFLAEAHLRADQEKQFEAYTKGVDFTERALLATSPEFERRVKAGESEIEAVSSVALEGVPAMYWYASNLGKFARAKGFTTTLFWKDRIKAYMERCLALDPTYFHGGPDRYFGAFYAVAPTFAGGDLNKSEQHFQKSIELAPDYIATKVLMAENLAVKRQDRALYERLLNEVLAAPDDLIPGLEPEARVEKDKARELLGLVDEKF